MPTFRSFPAIRFFVDGSFVIGSSFSAPHRKKISHMVRATDKATQG
jgi:hypothetical protein